MRKIAINLETRKRNASRSLPVITKQRNALFSSEKLQIPFELKSFINRINDYAISRKKYEKLSWECQKQEILSKCMFLHCGIQIDNVLRMTFEVIKTYFWSLNATCPHLKQIIINNYIIFGCMPSEEGCGMQPKI
jgi:hypothetical protein